MLVYYTFATQAPLPSIPQPSPVRQVRLGADLDALFDQALAVRGIAASELLRSAIARELSVDREVPAGEFSPKPAADLAEPVRLTIRLPHTVFAAAHRHAQTKGMAVSRWIAALTQSKVSTSPVLNQAEIASLNHCTRALDAIGRNINQIAHALNESRLQDSRYEETIKTLAPKISTNLDGLYSRIEDTRIQIIALTEASRKTWEPH